MGVWAYLNPFSYGKNPSTDYETILSRLSTSIADAKSSLSEIRLRERRFSLLLNLYGVALWIVWAALTWFGAVPWGLVGVWQGDSWVRVVEWLVVVLWPVGLVSLNRLLHLFYTRQRTKEEQNLRSLLTQQHTQLEAIKKATNYYSTRDLLEKYDAGAPGAGGGQAATPSKRPQQGTPQGTPGQGMPATPGTPSPAQGSKTASVAGKQPAAQPGALPPGMTVEQANLLRLQQQGQMLPMLPTPQKKWYDHLADKLMGDDPSQAAQTQYALVCGGCFRHNGLVGGGKEEWEKLQWICPRCGYFNPAPATRKSNGGSGGATSGLPPASPATPSPAPSTTLASQPGTGGSSRESSKRSLRQRSAKGSSGLKEVTNADDLSMDGMDVDEPDGL